MKIKLGNIVTVIANKSNHFGKSGVVTEAVYVVGWNRGIKVQFPEEEILYFTVDRPGYSARFKKEDLRVESDWPAKYKKKARANS